MDVTTAIKSGKMVDVFPSTSSYGLTRSPSPNPPTTKRNIRKVSKNTSSKLFALSFKRWIMKLQKLLMPELQISATSLETMDNLLSHVFLLLCSEANNLINKSGKKTLNLQQLRMATRLCLPSKMEHLVTRFCDQHQTMDASKKLIVEDISKEMDVAAANEAEQLDVATGMESEHVDVVAANESEQVDVATAIESEQMDVAAANESEQLDVAAGMESEQMDVAVAIKSEQIDVALPSTSSNGLTIKRNTRKGSKNTSSKLFDWNFKRWIMKLKKLLVPELEISATSLETMDNLLSHVFLLLGSEAKNLINYSGKKTLNLQQVRTATRLCLPSKMGDLVSRFCDQHQAMYERS